MAAGETTQGKRVQNLNEAMRAEGAGYEPGTYWPGRTLNDGRIEWWIVDPTGHIGSLSPDKHKVVEHDDGTITVSPSILSTQADHGHDWHGFLECGVWREV